MAVYDILPTENLRYDDIRDTLNANGGSVSNVVGTAFAEGANINKWAKYKPVAYPQPFTDNYPDWWKGFNGLCGISNFGFSNVKQILTYYKDNNFWVYTPPQGGEDEPFRLGDFRGYTSERKAIMKSPFVDDNVITFEYETPSASFETSFTVEHRINNANLLQLGDFNNIYDLSESKLCAFTFRANPMNDMEQLPNNIFVGDAVKGNSTCRVPMTLRTLKDNYIVLGLMFETHTNVYACLPIDIQESNFMSKIKWTYLPPYGIYLSYNKLGYEGLSTNSSLQDTRQYTEANPYKIEERGTMQFLLNVNNVKNQDVIFDTKMLYWDWDVSSIKSQLQVLKFNGSNVQGQSSITIPALFNGVDSMECEFSGLNYEISIMTTGWHELNLYVKRDADGSYTKIHTVRIYVQII